MSRISICLLLLLLTAPDRVMAQLEVLQPVPRLVVQRGADNTGRLYVSGRSPAADRINAQLTPITAGQGTATGVQTLQTNVAGGLFLGSIMATGGWYTLTVQAIRNGAVISQTTVQPVGIGEVFITAGQSNARGLGIGDNDLGTATGLVMSIDAINHYQPDGPYPIISSGDPLPVPVFTPLTAGHRIFPMAESSWGWGELGDYVVNRFNVPVVFYNTGWDASTAENWLSTANGMPTCNRYNCQAGDWQNLQPYTNLKNVLQYYGSTGGVRAILWHQGEAEYGDTLNGSVPDYANRLISLIGKSRANIGNRSVPWVIARASFTGGSTNPDVIKQQEKVISTPGLNVFRGPLNDTITNRNAGDPDVHFKNIQRPVTHPQYYLNPGSIPADMGLSRFARNWNNSLTNSFFQTAVPIVPEQFVATGDVTGNIAPNATISVPVASLGTFGTDNQWQVQLLDSLGRYLSTLGTSGSNPAQATWPGTVASGKFRLRVVSTNPVVMGVPTPVFCVGCPADVSLSIEADRRLVNVADATVFTIRLTNTGPGVATNVVVQDRLPPNMTVTSANGLTLSNGILTGTIPRIETGTTAVLNFQARVAAGTYRNSAEILHLDQVDPDSQAGSGTGDGQDDAATTDLRTRESGGGLYVSPNPNQTPLPAVASNQPTPDPNKADLSLSMWVDNRTPALNDVLTYTLQLANKGGQTAVGISLTAYLPTGQQFVPGDDFTVGGGGLTSGVGSLNANATVQLRFRARVTATGYAVTKAQVTNASPADPDSTPGNGTTNGEDDTAQTDIRSR